MYVCMGPLARSPCSQPSEQPGPGGAIDPKTRRRCFCPRCWPTWPTPACGWMDGWMNEQLTPYLATSLWYGALFAGLGILTNYWRCLSQLSLCVCVSSSEAAPRRSKLLAGWLAGCKESEIVWPYVWQLLYSASFKEDAYTRLHAFGSLVDDDKVAGGEYESVDVRAIVANPLPAATVHQIDDVTLMGILV